MDEKVGEIISQMKKTKRFLVNVIIKIIMDIIMN
jgi:hypothetical protein